MAGEDDDLGDLYGDLADDTIKVAATATKSPIASESSSSTPSVAKAPPSLKAPPPYSSSSAKHPSKQNQLEEKVKALEAENLTLKRNMGMLYRTARREIERKDRQIAELTAELDKKKST